MAPKNSSTGKDQKCLPKMCVFLFIDWYGNFCQGTKIAWGQSILSSLDRKIRSEIQTVKHTQAFGGLSLFQVIYKCSHVKRYKRRCAAPDNRHYFHRCGGLSPQPHFLTKLFSAHIRQSPTFLTSDYFVRSNEIIITK